MSATLLTAKDIVKEYRIGKVVTRALQGVSLDIAEGEFVAITGKSGSGKSTLLYQMSLLDRPTSGEVFIDGKDATKWTSKERVDARLSRFGYVFQDYALLPELTALENVYISHLMLTGDKGECVRRGKALLESVGLGDRYANKPSQLSGGEQQRVAIARALMNSPRILFADEPTANLDTETSLAVMDVFKQFHNDGITIVMVTHEPEYAQKADRIVSLADGHII
jgi:putative ABC transport system ATP-binding protein